MLQLPDSEKRLFINLVTAQARQIGMTPKEYIRKVWYHEQAARLGEFTALGLVEQLTSVIGGDGVDEVRQETTEVEI